MNDLVIKVLTGYKEDAFELFLLADPSYNRINNYIQAKHMIMLIQKSKLECIF